MDLLARFLAITDSIWTEGDLYSCLGVAEVLFERAAKLEGDERRKMLKCARAWKARAEERMWQ